VKGPVRERLRPGDLWRFFAPPGWATQWYYPEGVHGKVYNFFHGRGWRVI
jgi:hypothetical protein